MMRDTGKTHRNTTEFGAALALTSLVFAVYFWKKREELEHKAQ